MRDASSFEEWFDGSLVVDARGEPRLTFHGSNAHAYVEGRIETFQTRPLSGRGAAFFTSSRDLAAQYGERVYEVFLSLQNPLIVHGEGRPWSALSCRSRVEGKVTAALRDASRRQFDDIEALYAALIDGAPAMSSDSGPPRFDIESALLEGGSLGDLPGFTHPEPDTDAIVAVARRLGFDGVMFRDILDRPTYDSGYAKIVSDVFAVFDRTRIRHVGDVRRERAQRAAMAARDLVSGLQEHPEKHRAVACHQKR